MSRPAGAKRDGVIDSFRAIAILSVIIFHYFVRFAPPFHEGNLYGYDDTPPVFLEVGRLGVEVFFIISGYIIAMTLMRFETSVDFMIRRLSRLYPAFIVACVLTFICMRVFGPEERAVGFVDFIGNLTMVPMNLGFRAVDGAYWSLAVELKFYVLIAAGFLVLRSRYWVAILLVGLLGALLYQLQHLSIANGILIAPFMSFFIFGIGLWYLKSADRRIGILCLVVAAVCFGATRHSLLEHADEMYGYVYLLLVAGSLSALVLTGVNIAFVPLIFIGRISYSLYLVHQNVGLVIMRELSGFGVSHLAAAAIAFVVCCGLGYVLFRFVEGPGQAVMTRAISALKSRWQAQFVRRGQHPVEQPISVPTARGEP